MKPGDWDVRTVFSFLVLALLLLIGLLEQLGVWPSVVKWLHHIFPP